MTNLILYNTLTRKKEQFKPLNPPFVGLYVCGPTVYGDAHLGHARPAIIFDLLFRYLQYLNYKVRYVRNITDVGHLENDADSGEDKIVKKAKLEQLEPMEIVQRYTDRYHHHMEQLNVLKPSIEPRASGHIIEQQQFVQRILDRGYAYEINGSVYFDVEKYHKQYYYGRLSGRVLEDLHTQTRALEGQEEKRNPYDFALWKKADANHLMHWPSPWSEGFPGWHLECSTMSTKYLGTPFDIHGGGMDLLFPHHECEIAQSTAADGHEAVKLWMHNNMITINGQKMGKSLGNFITLDELFTGNHRLLQQAYNPMTVRFFILQAHYRSTVDFSNEALQSAEKGLARLMKAWDILPGLTPGEPGEFDVTSWKQRCFEALDDDLNTPVMIARLFEAVRAINLAGEGKASFSASALTELVSLFDLFAGQLLGLQKPEKERSQNDRTTELIEMVLQLRLEAKRKNDYATADRLRDELTRLGVTVKDKKDGYDWEWDS